MEENNKDLFDRVEKIVMGIFSFIGMAVVAAGFGAFYGNHREILDIIFYIVIFGGLTIFFTYLFIDSKIKDRELKKEIEELKKKEHQP